MLTPDEAQQYRQRTTILKQLGFSSYDNYCHSALWATIRAKILVPQARCRACGAPATQVHHNRYRREDMDGSNLRYLIPVCSTCHQQAEFNRAGEKIGPQRATAKLDTMRIEMQKIWRKQDTKAAWKYLFSTIEDVRIFLGMEESEDARRLVEQLDTALAALPPKYEKNHKRKRHHRAA
jgi:hypothetical protein